MPVPTLRYREPCFPGATLIGWRRAVGLGGVRNGWAVAMPHATLAALAGAVLLEQRAEQVLPGSPIYMRKSDFQVTALACKWWQLNPFKDILRTCGSQTERVHRHVNHWLGTFLHVVKNSLRTVHSGFSFSEKKGININVSPFCLLTFPSVLFSRLRAVSALPQLLPGLVWDHKRVTVAGFSCPLQGLEFQQKQLEHFCKSRKQIQSVCGPAAGNRFQYFHWLQLHTEKEGPLGTGQEGRYQSW